ncbi:MAG: LacI family DNA-binding transcriptional regulator [Spirochaetaceae bacterium]|nr:LacI family DNA-binding transcriptional regulator [Spirochaetaceae bacterium]
MITIKEIAELAGVSIGTVDRVLHNRGRVSETTRTSILSIVKEKGYRRNVVASQLSNNKKTVFAIIMPLPHQNDSFWDLIKSGIEAGREKLGFFKIDLQYFYFDRFDKDSYGREFKKAVEIKPHGFLIAPVLAEQAILFKTQIRENQKVVLINSDLPDFPRISHIGQNSYSSGRTAGKLMTQIIPQNGDIAVIEVEPEDYHINIRARGFKEYIAENSGSKVKTYLLPMENKQLEFEITGKRIIVENKNLKGLFVPNSSVHYFAELIKDIKIIGYDLVHANAEMLSKGKIDFLINQQPAKQGELALEYLFRNIVLQEKVKEFQFLPIEIICRENLESYREGGKNE